MPIIVKCPVCNKEITAKPSKVKKQKNVFCSKQCKCAFQKGKPAWNKGRELPSLTPEHRKRISLGVLSNPNIKHTQFKKGHKWTDEAKSKRAETLRQRGSLKGSKNGMYEHSGSLNPNWQGGTSYWRKEYYNSIPYKEWRLKVLKVDNFTCQICGVKERSLHIHHIKSFAKYPKLRLDPTNGVTICKKCHDAVHSRQVKIGRIIEVVELKDTSKMIDIEVETNNNFFANSVLVHNSATPYREDGRTDYIFALTGYPVGLSWDFLIKQGFLKKPDVRLYILSDMREKERKLTELLQIEKKTIIFCDTIALGEKLSKTFEVPFVYGATKDRLGIIKSADTSIVSRVGDEGLSIPELERVIEYDFFGGSRRQEGQRFGRSFHGEDCEYIILMTEKEFDEYDKRLYAIHEKGFRIEVVR